ncbi:alkyl sulfatase dimerization domain-containing protein [Sporosarcina sp. 179-K 3D1 HS]|uniref:alkyl/aryl-sulfatase n=1 Tax=Sporosarcina sp. 179-K 3D1 HS TaxID=3232169 RepID=UPI0039A2926D
MLKVMNYTSNQSGQSNYKTKDATSFTKAIHEKYLEYLNFDDRQDFEDADRGLIASYENDIEDTLNANSRTSPDTVNPSLWRNVQLQAKAGLYKVVDGVYQVRGLAIATTIFVEGKTGVIVVDTSIGMESAKKAIELYYSHRPKKPVSAIILSHSHIDHYGGTKAILEYAEDPDIPIIVPEHFTKEAYSENVMLGPIMGRRAVYQFGHDLPTDDRGYVSAGIGSVWGSRDASSAQDGFQLPNVEITNEYERLEVDGITFQFLLAPNTEAPAEMHFYIKDYKTLFLSENTNKAMHQIYTIRGAKTRDTLQWVGKIDQTIELFGNKEIDALLLIHGWPIWGKERILDHLRKQRDQFKFTHDQTVRLANHGYTMEEIAEMLVLPDPLAKHWANREYYGTVSLNSKGVYTYYLGFYNGHPSDLNPLPQVEAGKKFVQYMGGTANIMRQAKADYEKGEYRWVAQVLKHVVMGHPENMEAKNLLADAFEQLGYQTESSNWRNAYLMGAMELRNGLLKKDPAPKKVTEMTHRIPYYEYCKLLAVRLNGPKADGIKININVSLSDSGDQFTIHLENSVLNIKKELDSNADVSLTTDKSTFYEITGGDQNLGQAKALNKVKFSGDENKFSEFLSLLDDFDNPINIVIP